MAKIKQEKRKYLLLSPEDPQRSVYNQLTPPSFPSVFHYEESLLKRLDAIKPNRVTPRVGVARDILKKGLVLTIEDIENSEVTILDPAPVIDALSLAYYSGLPIRQEGDETYFEISERELEILCRVFNKRENNFLSGTLKLRGIRLKKENSFPEKPSFAAGNAKQSDLAYPCQ